MASAVEEAAVKGAADERIQALHASRAARVIHGGGKMTSDYKYEMQMLAEERAERDGLDYDRLPLESQLSYYEKGRMDWIDRRMQAADLARDRERENG